MPDLNFSPEQLQALASLGVAPEKLNQLKQQYGLAQTMRMQGAPQGRQAGRTYHAANPLEHLGRGMQQYRAGKQMGDLRGEMKNELANIEKIRMQEMARLLGGRGGQQPQQMPQRRYY